MRLPLAFLEFLFACTIGLASGKSQCGQFPAPGFDGLDMSSFVGEYSNPNYLFAVTIPAGLVGHSSPPPSPQHGFGVVLSWEPRAYFWLDSSTNALEWPDEKHVLADHLEWKRGEAERILSVHQHRASFGIQPAHEQIIRYVCPNSHVERVEVTVISLRRGLVDTAGLLTTAERFKSDYRLFMSVVASWRTTGKY
jgi:hypothetical protein